MIVIIVLSGLSLIVCCEDTPTSTAHIDYKLVIDSVDVYIVNGMHPYDSIPAGKAFWHIYYKLEGSTGALFRADIYPNEPGDVTFAIESPGSSAQPPNIPLEKHWSRWVNYDYSAMDSIWTHIYIEAHFWKDYHFPSGRVEQRYLGEEGWFMSRKIDIRDSDEM